MAEVIVFRDEAGKLAGLGESGARAFAKFRAAVDKLDIGETLTFSWKAPRSPQFHRRHFAVLAAMFEQQDQFQDADAFRMWVQVGAGFCDLMPGPKGKPVAMPKSIKWDRLDDVEFAEHHAAVIAFMRSTHFTRFLWPWMTDLQADSMVDGILSEFQ